MVNTFSCAPAMRPWDYIWMEQWRHHAEEAVFEAWLFVAWVFEDNDIFQRLTRKFTRIGVMKDEEFVIDINTPFHKDLPHVLLENMREARSTAMLDVIKEMRDLYDKYEAGICTGKKIPCTCYETETGKCNAITFAGLHAGFKNIEKRGPLALTLCFNAYQAMSLEVLAQNISSIKWTPLADRSYYTCTPIPQLAKAVNGHIENIKPLDLSWDGYNDRTSRRVEVKWHDIFSTEFSY
ncbi:hypothetical protein EDC01DRAFT_11568 [Geopyxis carbonaria]|nr:hypothetical protein EDC01DRAFT_11568 [Geopyxis carbonaria]